MEVDRRTFVKGGIVAAAGATLKRGAQFAIKHFWRDPRFRPSLRNLKTGAVR